MLLIVIIFSVTVRLVGDATGWLNKDIFLTATVEVGSSIKSYLSFT